MVGRDILYIIFLSSDVIGTCQLRFLPWRTLRRSPWAPSPSLSSPNRYCTDRVSSKQTNKYFGSNETTRNKICFGCVLWNQKQKISVCFGISNLYRLKTINWNKQNCFETNRNNPKFSEKYQNMLSIKLFWFNQNIETLYFGLEPKQPKQTVSKQTKTNRKTQIFLKKYQNMLSITLFLLLFCLFRFNETPKFSASV